MLFFFQESEDSSTSITTDSGFESNKESSESYTRFKSTEQNQESSDSEEKTKTSSFGYSVGVKRSFTVGVDALFVSGSATAEFGIGEQNNLQLSN